MDALVPEAQDIIAELERRLNERTAERDELLEQQIATDGILKVIAGSPSDVQPVFDAIAASANRLIAGFSATVMRFIGDGLHLVASTPTNAAADEALKASFPRPLAEFPPFELVRGGETVQFADTEAVDVPPVNRQLARLRGYRSMLFTPLMSNSTAIGILSVTRVQPGGFAKHHVQLLKTFAAQAVIAIENTRLFNETMEALDQQKASADILRVISNSMANTQPVFDKILLSIEHLFGSEERVIFLVGDDGLLHIGAMHGPNAERARSLFPAPLERTGSERAIRERRLITYGDVFNDPDVPSFLRANALRIGDNYSLAIAPMLWEDRAVGSVVVARHTMVPFNEKECSLLRTFADQAVIAIQNERMFNEVQARTDDLREALQQQTATADVLKVISRSAFNLQTVLDTLVESAARLCEAEKGVIFLREGNHYKLVSNYGFSAEFEAFAKANPFPADGGSTTSRAGASSGAVQVVDVLADDARSDLAREYQRLAGFRTNLGVPLRREGETIGVFTLTRQVVRAFTKRQIELAETFADQAVIAISNVRLFEQVQARTKELAGSLEDLRTAQDRLVQTEKLASLGQLTAGIAHEIKNPLNFVNNFSSLSAELIDELDETLAPAALDHKMRGDVGELTQMLKSNLKKVVQHGKRADSIVKNMLQHSREGSGERRSQDLNALVSESLNLAYHGARAERSDFNITLKQDLDPDAGALDLYPQEMTRALLNLISNGFYAATKRKTELTNRDFEPVLSAVTKNLGNAVEIRIRDNGTGIAAEVREKMFNPFFTTKPTGEGTGLGLSMTHDIIVKQHGGRIDVQTEPGSFTEFIITLPRDSGTTGSRRPE
jgi:signal transduction histidine kinase